MLRASQTTRVIGGQSYTLGYDAEGHLVSVSGPSLPATFTYDGDGARRRGIINGVTTKFVGTHYEDSSGAVTKYYYIGGQRVAMRQGEEVYYLLGDHPSAPLRASLGSTALTTDSSGALTGELRYKAWGERRYTSGATPTKYTYTGQYSNVSEFGLLYYNARWYDPALGHFAQADTIVPGAANPQMFNRYSYVGNSPLNFNDPTGHGGCDVEKSNLCGQMKQHKADYGKHLWHEGGYGREWNHSGTLLPLPHSQPGQTSMPNGVLLSELLGWNGVAYSYSFAAWDSATRSYMPYALSTLGGAPNPIEAYCGSRTALACLAMLTQDVATLVDLVGAGVALVLIADVCFAGPPIGCGGGLVAGWTMFNLTGLNAAETFLSGASLALTTVADYVDDGELGEAFGTSLSTFAVGGMSWDPIADLAIDAYASGYNHGLFNGVQSIMNGGSFTTDME